MTKEELNQLKKEIALMSQEEKIRRDLELRKISLKKIEGELTGYPSTDKPWLKYYNENQIDYTIPKATCYELLFQNNKNHLNEIAIEYFGRKITYKELFENIASTAKAFQKMGVKKGDIVSFLAVHTPEVVYSFYALNRIGAISNMIDPRSNPKALEKYFNEVGSNVVVSLSNFRDNVLEALPNTSVNKVIEIDATNSTPFPINIISRMKKKKKDFNIIDWNSFIKNGKSVKLINDVPYIENYPATIVHTGGTTGVPKGVLLSNDNMTAVVYETLNTPLPLNRQDRFMNITVPFVAFGLALGMHAPMTLGWKSILIPNYEIEKMNSLMKKYKPQLVMGTQTYYEPLLNIDKYSFKNTKAMLTGGMPTGEEFEIKINKKIKDNGGDLLLSKGYSMTEASSMGTCSYNNANEIGSNGVPLSKTIVSTFVPGTDEELPFGELGEICISSPTIMLGYYGNEKATNDVIKIHSDGTKWVHSGDLGYITKDGFVYVKDRIKRMIIRSGFKVFPSEIEKVICTHPNVVNCCVVSMDDDRDNKAPVAFTILKDKNVDISKFEKELKDLLVKNGLPVYFEPVKIFVVDEFPITNVGKIDFRQLENIANDDYKNQKSLKKQL